MSATAVSQRRFVIEPRSIPSFALKAAVTGVSLVAAFGVGAILLAAAGRDPGEVYRTMIESSLGSVTAFSQTLVQAAPLILTGVATAIAFRMRVFTIGADGQLIAGAIAASGVALMLGDGAPGALLILVMVLAGIAGGVAWAAVPGVGRAYLRVNEVVSTLMLNFVALALMTYLVIGSTGIWRDQENLAAAQAAPIPAGARLPDLFGSADLAIVIAVAVALASAALVRWTSWGFAMDVIGDSPRAAGYAGMSVSRGILTVFCVAGALAGLAGALQVTSVTYALDPQGVNPGLGLGYTGIVVAALARLSIIGVIPFAVLVAALFSSGSALQLVGVSSSLVVVLQGLILLFVAGGQFHLAYRIRRPLDLRTQARVG